MTQNPKIIVIETGTMAEEFESKHGDYPSMFARLLGEQGLNLEVCRVVRGDDIPALESADGFLITGSRHGVYDNLPWMEPLKTFIQSCAQKHVPIIGICFGHQIMAEALGGKVVKSEKGWGLGPSTYTVTNKNLLTDAPDTLTINAIHQDQVVKKPADAEVICSSEFCEFAGLVYGGNAPYALSLQPHPEFKSDFVSDLISARRGDAYPVDVADSALAKMDNPLDSHRCAKWFADFYKSTITAV